LILATAVGGGRPVTAHAGRFLRVDPAEASSRPGPPEAQALRFLAAHAGVLGIRDVAKELAAPVARGDIHGWRHLSYAQVHDGVPVLGALLRAHVDPGGALTLVNGTFLADVTVDATAALSSAQAAGVAVDWATARTGRQGLVTASTRLLVFREGLAGRASGPDHLAWEVEVGNGVDVRELVYVDAHDGQVVHRIAGIHEALSRRVYLGSLGSMLQWTEGDPLPAADPDVTNLVVFTGNAYRFYLNAFGRDSYDGAGSVMQSVRLFDDPSCPNAFATGTFTSFCPGVTYDDVVAHEWTHVYTAFTDGLIYEGEPGALNESFSDVFGESVERVNTLSLDPPRTDGHCSAAGLSAVTVQVNAPPAIAGPLLAEDTQFGPRLAATGITANLALVDDGSGDHHGCGPGGVANGGVVSGRAALVLRGGCTFVEKVANAQAVGAVAVVVANNVPGLVAMGGFDPGIVIPSVMITQDDDGRIEARLAAGDAVNVTLRIAGAPLDASDRWVTGEEAGGLRDLWNPTCFNDPGKVSDAALAVCDPDFDSGGVHENSGIPNHAYALLVDGGTFNGTTVTGIGLTKAAHVYFRAMSVYQTPLTDFADHADALEQSCADLVGVDLRDPGTGAPSGQRVTADDCAQVAAAMAAVEMRGPLCGASATTTTTTTSTSSTIARQATTTSTLPARSTTSMPAPPRTFLDDVLQGLSGALETTPLRRHGLRFAFVAPTPGRLRVVATGVVGAATVTVARARLNVRRAGAAILRLRPTRPGRRLLRGSEGAAVALQATFVGTQGELSARRDAFLAKASRP
jgi:hypothetical protein